MGEAERVNRAIAGCRLCAERFAATATRHAPRPIAWLSGEAPIVLASQAPGMRAHGLGRPFIDPSGDRLRAWLGVERAQFYDRRLFGIVPMAFCFPGYDANGGDLPPPRICAATWREAAMAAMPQRRLLVLIGAHALRWHLGRDVGRTVAETVQNWQRYGPGIMPLPHPSWRNTAWLKRNPWFEAELVPELQQRVAAFAPAGLLQAAAAR